MGTSVIEKSPETDLAEFAKVDQSDPALDLMCEHEKHDTGQWGHEGPGRVLLLILHDCPARTTQLYLMCQGGWDHLNTAGYTMCGDCGWKGPVSEALREVGYLD